MSLLFKDAVITFKDVRNVLIIQGMLSIYDPRISLLFKECPYYSRTMLVVWVHTYQGEDVGRSHSALLVIGIADSQSGG